MRVNTTRQDRIERSLRLLARLRARQLETARAGDVRASARYARRVKVVIRAAEATVPAGRAIAS